MLEMERYLIGTQRYPHGKVWNFTCEMCGKKFRYDQPGEPLCTGPSETVDVHPPEAMLLLSVEPVGKNEKMAPPGVAHERVAGALYIPGNGFADIEEE
jgi:hypothetical protein